MIYIRGVLTGSIYQTAGHPPDFAIMISASIVLDDGNDEEEEEKEVSMEFSRQQIKK